MMHWSHVRGREIVATDVAERVGNVDSLVIDPDRHAIVALVSGRRVVSWSDAGGVGSDAVTISNSDMLRDPRSDTETGAVDRPADPVAKPVFTEDGFAVGTVADLVFDPETGEIQQLSLADDEVAGSRLLGIGSFAVVVASEDGTTRTTHAATRAAGKNQASNAPSGKSSDELSNRSKTELYELAQERDIPGRSKMNKQELLDALS